MRIKKSIHIEGWFGFFDENNMGYPEEFFSVKTLSRAEEIVNQLVKDIEKLKNSQTT